MIRRLAAAALTLALTTGCTNTGPESESGVVDPATTPARSGSTIADVAGTAAPPGSSTPASTVATIATVTTTPSETVPPCAGDPGWVNRRVVLPHDGADREYLVATPPAPAAERRLLIDLHGWSGSADGIDAVTGLATAGSARGYVVVTPQSLGDPTEWNFTGNPDAADDYGFLDALVTDALDRYCIGTGDVVVVGTSNGAAMAGLYACRDPRVVAVVMVIATVPCSERAAPASALSIRATGDPVVPYAGGAEALGAWAFTATCSANPEISDVWPGVTRAEYADCPAGVRVAFDTIDGGTHAWPGGGDQYPATQAILDFLETP